MFTFLIKFATYRKILCPRTPFNVERKNTIFPQGNATRVMCTHRKSSITSLDRSPAFDRWRTCLKLRVYSFIHHLFKIMSALTFLMFFNVIMHDSITQHWMGYGGKKKSISCIENVSNIKYLRYPNKTLNGVTGENVFEILSDRAYHVNFVFD